MAYSAMRPDVQIPTAVPTKTVKIIAAIIETVAVAVLVTVKIIAAIIETVAVAVLVTAKNAANI